MSPDNPYVLKSYRYLRLVMVGLVVLLAASVTGDDQCVCHASILPDRRVS